jgi:hypothetical protein
MRSLKHRITSTGNDGDIRYVTLTGVDQKDMARLGSGFICFVYNHIKSQFLKISPLRNFTLEVALALELIFLWDELVN